MDEGLAAGIGSAAELALAAAATGAGHGPHGPASTRCLNCGHRLGPQDRFCSACGQDTANHPPTLIEFVHEFVDHYVAAEGKLWRSLWGLLAKPGFLTLEYLAGRKGRYVLPLRLLLSLGLVFFLALKLVPGSEEAALPVKRPAQTAEKAEPVEPAASASVTAARTLAQEFRKAADAADEAAASAAAGPPPQEQQTGLNLPQAWRAGLPEAVNHRIDAVKGAFRKDPEASVHRLRTAMLGFAPYAVLCSLPFFAAFLKLLFWRQTYGTHFVFAMHLHAAWYGMLLATVLLPWSVMGFAVWLWSNVYPVVALKRVHAAGWVTTLLRAAVLAVLHWIVIATALLALVVAGLLSVA